MGQEKGLASHLRALPPSWSLVVLASLYPFVGLDLNHFLSSTLAIVKYSKWRRRGFGSRDAQGDSFPSCQSSLQSREVCSQRDVHLLQCLSRLGDPADRGRPSKLSFIAGGKGVSDARRSGAGEDRLTGYA